MIDTGALRGLVALLAVPLGLVGSASASPGRWTADLRRSQLVVHVYKRGLLSGMAHDHHFAAGDWRVTATIDGERPTDARVEAVIAAGSLRDRQPALSDADRKKVDAQASGPSGLDAGRYPEIRFASQEPAGAGLTVEPDGVAGELPGTLSLHGKERPVSISVHATRDGKGWRARGAVRFKQSDFGIEPYSGFLGTIAVHDEVSVEYDLVLVPAR